uniref:Uncharacterized protein n=1 Tax=Vespula pensylvanica TaxID=30213 RepID=A0A834NLP8_VESPE|nr:hypothetical protein H0235_012610 [Vespula pensylvanica]
MSKVFSTCIPGNSVAIHGTATSGFLGTLAQYDLAYRTCVRTVSAMSSMVPRRCCSKFLPILLSCQECSSAASSILALLARMFSESLLSIVRNRCNRARSDIKMSRILSTI